MKKGGEDEMEISKKKIYEEVVEAVIKNIQEGIWSPGDKLPAIATLAVEYGVSQASIREALNSLKVMGIVEVKHGQGTYIKSGDTINLEFKVEVLTKEDIKNLLEVRRIVEIGCVGLAAERITEAELKHLSRAMEDMHTAVHYNALGEQADYEFHVTIAKASSNPMLASLLENISEIMIEGMRETRRIWLYNREETVQNIYDQHSSIFHALKDGNSRHAEQAMRAHLDSVEKTLLENL